MPPNSSSSVPFTGSAVVSSAVGLDLDHLAVGCRWRGRYLVQEILPDITYGKMLTATQVDDGRDVTIRSFRVTDDLRERAWRRLSEYTGPGITPLLESAEQDGRRLEVVANARGANLSSWLVGRNVGLAEIKPLIAQLAEVIAALHERGVVHLNLSPSTVFLEKTDDSFRFVVGGLETVTDITRSALVSINVNPFYAPPDAVGLYQHHCGPTLRPWDWWSVGRIVQEMILGGHILGVMLNRDVSRQTPELLMRADQFLHEAQSDQPRAGGVEAMPDGLDPALKTLLRGLLSSSRDARWGIAEVRGWLRGEKVKERYHLPKNEHLFTWKDHAYTVSEFAQLMSEGEHWSDGVTQIFHQKDPTTLINFLAEDPAWRKTGERIAEWLKLPDSAAFAEFPASASRDVVTGLALTLLAHGTIPMRWRGRDVDAKLFSSLLEPKAQPEGLLVVRALCEDTAVKHVALLDADTARFLTDFSRAAEGAFRIAQARRWVSFANPEAVAALFAQALISEPAHRKLRTAARELYAISRDEQIDKIFNHPAPSESELLVVNWALQTPDTFGFVTHAVWSEELYSKIKDEGAVVVRAESWINLAARLRTGLFLFGPWVISFAVWALTSASIALSYPSRLTLFVAFFPPLIALVLRRLNALLIRTELHRQNLEISASTRLSPAACLEAARRILPPHSAFAAADLHRRWSELNTTIAKLRVPTPLEPIAPAARFAFTRYSTWVGSAMFAGAIGILGLQAVQHFPTWPVLAQAWMHPKPSPETPPRGLRVPLAALPESDEPETSGKTSASAKAEESTKMSWSFRKNEDPQEVRMVRTDEANPEQSAAGREAGVYAIRGYKPETISGLIAVQVTVENGIGLMLFDGKAGKLVGKHVYVIGFVPLARSWLQLDDQVAIFLGNN